MGLRANKPKTLLDEATEEVVRLRAENKRLEERAAYAEQVWRGLGASRETLQAEIERLRVENAYLKDTSPACAAEAVRESERAQKAEAENERLKNVEIVSLEAEVIAHVDKNERLESEVVAEHELNRKAMVEIERLRATVAAGLRVLEEMMGTWSGQLPDRWFHDRDQFMRDARVIGRPEQDGPSTRGATDDP